MRMTNKQLIALGRSAYMDIGAHRALIVEAKRARAAEKALLSKDKKLKDVKEYNRALVVLAKKAVAARAQRNALTKVVEEMLLEFSSRDLDLPGARYYQLSVRARAALGATR